MRCSLKEVADLIAGYAFKSKDFGDNYPDKVIKITNISPPNVAMSNLTAVDLTKYNEETLRKYVAKQGDYVLAMTGATIGKIGRIVKGEAYINQRVLMFKPHDNVNKDYLYYVLNQKDFGKYILNYVDSESAQPNISAGTIGKFEFNLPEMDEQIRVGKVLRILDEKIEIDKQINDNLEQQAMTMIEDYITDVNESIVLNRILSFVNGYAFQSKTYLSEGKYRIITIKNVQDGMIDSQGAAFINEIPSRMKAGCFLQEGDVLLSLTGYVGRVGIVYEKNLLLNQRVAKFVPVDSLILPWLYYYFRLPSIKLALETIAKGTAQLNLSPVETLNLQVPFEMSSAKKLSNILWPIFNQEIANNIETLRLSELRNILLPRLMSGEIDVSNIAV